MSYAIRFRPIATKDFEEACEWYASKSEQTEEDFKTNLRERLYEIAENPEAYTVRLEKRGQLIRAANIKKFPYLIFFTVHNNLQCVRIISIWHQSRNPDVLSKRL